MSGVPATSLHHSSHSRGPLLRLFSLFLRLLSVSLTYLTPQYTFLDSLTPKAEMERISASIADALDRFNTPSQRKALAFLLTGFLTGASIIRVVDAYRAWLIMGSSPTPRIPFLFLVVAFVLRIS